MKLFLFALLIGTLGLNAFADHDEDVQESIHFLPMRIDSTPAKQMLYQKEAVENHNEVWITELESRFPGCSFYFHGQDMSDIGIGLHMSSYVYCASGWQEAERVLDQVPTYWTERFHADGLAGDKRK